MSDTRSTEAGRCRAPVGSGGLCGESTDFKIMEEFNCLYSERVSIAEDAGRTELLIRTLKEWVADLNKTNAALVDSIKELEAVALAGCASCRKKNCEKTDESEKLNKELNEKEEKIQCLERNVKDLNDLLCEKETIIQNINLKLEEMKKCLDLRTKKAKDSVECLEKRVEELRIRNEQCMNNSSRYENELRLKEEEILDLKNQLENYVTKGKRLSSEQRNFDGSDELSSLREKLIDYEQQLKDKSIRIRHLENSLYDKSRELDGMKTRSSIDDQYDVLALSKVYSNYSKGRNSEATNVSSAFDQSQLKKIGELRNSLREANDEITSLKSVIKEKDHQISNINIVEISKTNIPDASLSSKLDEFQRFMDECGCKLRQTLMCLKQYPQTEQIFQDIEDYKNHLVTEEETLSQMLKMFDEIRNAFQSSHKGLSNETDTSTILFLIENVATEMNRVVNENKCQKEKLMANLENQKADFNSFNGSLITLEQQMSLYHSAIDKIKQEIKLVVFNATRKGEQVRKQSDKLEALARLIQEIKCSVQKLDETAAVSKMICQINKLERVYFDVMAMKKSSEKKSEFSRNKKSYLSVNRECSSSPQLGNSGCDFDLFQEGSFQDKSNIAQELFSEIGKELEACRKIIFQREDKLNKFENRILCFRSCSSNLTEKLDELQSLLHMEDCNVEEVIHRTVEIHQKLIAEFHSISRMLHSYEKVKQKYEMMSTQSKLKTQEKMCELSETINDLLLNLGELREKNLRKTQRKCSSTMSTDDSYPPHNHLGTFEIQEVHEIEYMQTVNMSPDSSSSPCDKFMISSSLQEGNKKYMKEIIMKQEEMIKSLNNQMECLKKDMEDRVNQICREKEISVTKSQDVIDDLQKKISHLQESLHQSSKVQEDYLRTVFCRLSQKEMELLVTINRLKKQVDSRTMLLLRQDSQICELELQLDQFNDMLLELEEEQLFEKNTLMQGQRRINSDNEEQGSGLESIFDQNTMLCKENYELKINLFEVSETNEKLEKEICIYKQMISSLKKEKVSLINQIYCLQQSIKSLNADEGEPMNVSKEGSTNVCLEYTTRNLCSNFSNEEILLDKKKNEMQLVQNNYHSLLRDREELLEENKQLCGTVKSLREKNESLIVASEKSNEWFNETIQLKCELKELTLKMKKLDDLNSLLTRKFEDFKYNSDTEKQNLTKENDKLNSQLLCLIKQYNHLEQTHEEESSCLKNKILELQKKLYDLEQEVSSTRKMRHESEIVNEDTKSLFQKKMKEWALKYKEKCCEVGKLREQIDALNNALETHDEKMIERNESCNITRKKMENLKKLLADKDYEILSLHNDLKNALSENLQTEESSCKMKEQIQSMAKCLCFLRNEKEELEWENCKLKDKLALCLSSDASSKSSNKKDPENVCRFPIEIDCDRLVETFEDNKKLLSMVRNLQATNMSIIHDIQKFGQEN